MSSSHPLCTAPTQTPFSVCTLQHWLLTPEAPACTPSCAPPLLCTSHPCTLLPVHHSVLLTPGLVAACFPHPLDPPGHVPHPLGLWHAHPIPVRMYPLCIPFTSSTHCYPHRSAHSPPRGWPLNPQPLVETLGWRHLCAGGSRATGEGKSVGGDGLTRTLLPLSPLHREEPKLCHFLLHGAQGLRPALQVLSAVCGVSLRPQ